LSPSLLCIWVVGPVDSWAFFLFATAAFSDTIIYSKKREKIMDMQDLIIIGSIGAFLAFLGASKKGKDHTKWHGALEWLGFLIYSPIVLILFLFLSFVIAI
jgi:hypothetical protein